MERKYTSSTRINVSPQNVFLRKKLFRLLDDRESPIVWVCGPAGSGKTTLLNSYIENRALPVDMLPPAFKDGCHWVPAGQCSRQELPLQACRFHKGPSLVEVSYPPVPSAFGSIHRRTPYILYQQLGWTVGKSRGDFT